MTGQELIDWIKKNNAEDMLILVDRDGSIEEACPELKVDDGDVCVFL